MESHLLNFLLVSNHDSDRARISSRSRLTAEGRLKANYGHLAGNRLTDGLGLVPAERPGVARGPYGCEMLAIPK